MILFEQKNSYCNISFFCLFFFRINGSKLQQFILLLFQRKQSSLMIFAQFLTTTFNYASGKQSKPVEETNDQFLPGDLAGRILNLEMECEGAQISKELLGELIDLYRSAIEYYESINCEKYKIYKKRLQTFISKPSIEEKLRGKDGTLILKKEMVERNKLHATVNTKEEIAKIIQKSNKRADSNQKIIEKQIKSQHENLEARIQRRKSMSNKSTKTDNDDFDQVSINKKENKKQTMKANFLLSEIKNRNVKRVFI